MRNSLSVKEGKFLSALITGPDDLTAAFMGL